MVSTCRLVVVARILQIGSVPINGQTIGSNIRLRRRTERRARDSYNITFIYIYYETDAGRRVIPANSRCRLEVSTRSQIPNRQRTPRQ